MNKIGFSKTKISEKKYQFCEKKMRK